MKTATTRPQWPHTIEDVTNSLDGIWGLVGATAVDGNLYRLERSLHEPLTYTLTEYRGDDESNIVRRQMYGPEKREEAVKEFAQAIGFEIS